MSRFLAHTFLIVLLHAADAHAQKAPPANKEPMDYSTCTLSGCHGEKVQKRFIHAPLRESECGLCHKPVMGKHEFRILDTSSRICVDCHTEYLDGNVQKTRDGLVIKSNKANHFTHPFNSKVSLPLVSKPAVERLHTHQMKYYDGKITCLTCHDPHQADNRSFLRDFTTGDSRTAFCTRCHADERNLQHPLFSEGKSGKRPKREDVQCEACHSVHRATYPNLLDVPQNSSQGATLCMNCHADQVAGRAHPAQSGDCAACHAFHKHVLPNTPLIKASASKSGGPVCYDCHGDKRMMEGTPHDYFAMNDTVKKEVKSVLEKEPTIQCEFCHDMHKGATQGGLLAKLNYKSEQLPVTASCLACHENSKTKSIAQVHLYDKSVSLMMNFFEGKDRKIHMLKFFDKDANLIKDPTATVHIGCGTCHDPHKWAGSTQKIRGIARYLREHDDIVPYCAACHGSQAILIYTLFHTDRFRKK